MLPLDIDAFAFHSSHKRIPAPPRDVGPAQRLPFKNVATLLDVDRLQLLVEQASAAHHSDFYSVVEEIAVIRHLHKNKTEPNRMRY